MKWTRVVKSYERWKAGEHQNDEMDGDGEDVAGGAREAQGDVEEQGRIVRRGLDGGVVNGLRPRQGDAQAGGLNDVDGRGCRR